MSDLYIGLMAGTSADGIDAALVRIDAGGTALIAARTQAYPASVAAAVHELAHAASPPLAGLGTLHAQLGELFAEAVTSLLRASGTPAERIAAIGCPGQTIRHQPGGEYPFTLQIGDAARVAARTGIATVCDFRSADIAAGGQGAPLAPAFHASALRDPAAARVIVNLGGIANLTYLPAAPGAPILGFDTGPGNTLLDAWVRRQRGRPYDDRGAWARTGRADPARLQALLGDPFFAAPAPKSTGLEHFHLDWLRRNWPGLERADPADVQATLVELTAHAVAAGVRQLPGPPGGLYVCGGGAFNEALMESLQARMERVAVASTATLGIAPEWVEAVAFAWLAQRRVHALPGNLPSVTGARRAVVLGALHAP